MPSKRIDWVDQLKGITMIFVVIGHFVPYGSPMQIICYSFHMPLFLIISGFTTRIHRNRHSLSEERFGSFVWKKFKQLIIPFFLLNALFLPLSMFNVCVLEEKTYNFGRNILGIIYSNQDFLPYPTAATWFLPCLFLGSIIFYFVEKWSKDKDLYIIIMSFGLVIVSFLLGNIKDFDAPWDCFSAPFAAGMMGFGFVIMKYIPAINAFLNLTTRIKIISWCTAIFLFLLGINLSLLNGKVSVHVLDYHNHFLFLLNILIFSTSLVFIAMNLKKLWVLNFIGANSMFYMASHCVIRNTFMDIMGTEVFYNTFVLQTIIIIALIIPLTMLVNRYIPFVVGRKYKKKEKPAEPLQPENVVS